ncbi:CAND1 [Symbiodinium pilosum]|uniref:CAND1 protein n=1 Tax=Symbiodinium pilosum TaxID=2952 RepID=A0A812VJS3_SYMPI|nr:CAND1 [Symbiodinium pilosum]
MAMNPSSVSQLLEDMENWDKDKRFMAASDLTQEVTMSNQVLDVHLQKRVCQAFVKQLEDQSIDVQGNAVKCLAKIVCKFQEQQIGEVLAKLSQQVLDGKAEVRDIYATCLKGLLSELPASCSALAGQNVLPKMLHGITSIPSLEVKEECTDVFHDFLKRFGDNRIMQWSDQDNMATSLLNLLKPKQHKTSLRKKVIACIGALSAVLADRQLDTLMRTLLADVRSAGTKAEKQKYIQCISTVSRNVGFRIGQHLKEIAPLFFQIVTQATQEDVSMDGDNEKDHEVVENCLNAFECFVLRCSKEMMPHLDELCGVILNLVAYDPNFYDSGDGQDAAMDDGFEEFDEDGLVDSDDDDNSWKVRRAALKVLEAMVKGLPDRLDEIYTKFAQPLIARFNEREESVKLDVFTTFGEMAQAAVIKTQPFLFAATGGASAPSTSSTFILEVERALPPKERPNSHHLIAVIPACISQLNKQMRSKAAKTRQGALTLLRTLSECIPQHVEPNFPQVKDELVRAMKESNSSMRLDSLILTRHLAEYFLNAATFQQLAPELCPLFLTCCSDSYYKSIAQALRAIGAYVYTLRPTPEAVSPELKVMLPVYDVLKTKLLATDIDQEVKESALECLGHLVACTGDLPDFQPPISDCLPSFVERIKNEVTRTTAIKALRTMCISKVQISGVSSILPAVGATLSQYLSQNSRSFRQQCLDALVHLIKKYGSGMPQETIMQILGDMVPFITDTDLYITDLCVQIAVQVLATSPRMAPQVIERCVPAVLTVCRSPLLQGSALDSILNFLSRVAQHREHCPFEKLRQELSNTSVIASAQAQAQRHVIGTLAKGLAAVTAASAPDVQKAAVQHFLESVKKTSGNPAQEVMHQCELSLLALGETGKYADLSGVPGFCDVLLHQLESQQDEIRLAAALALGYATVGAMGTLLKVVIDNVQQAGAEAQKKQYLLLTSLREVIAIGVAERHGSRALAEHLKPHVPRVLPILQQYADSQEESMRNVVSESLGHLLAVDQDAVMQALTALLSNRERESWRMRAAAVAAVRFAAAKQCQASAVLPLKEALLVCLGDEELQVRKAALHSVNVVCVSPTCSEILRDSTDLVLERIKEDSKQKPELIREVDLGPFKHKVDDGLPLRKFAYTVCCSLLAAYPEQIASPALIDLVLQGMGDNEDIQVICCQLLQDLCSWQFALYRIIGRVGDLVEPFDRCIMRWIKQVQAKQQVGRAMDMLRLYARTLKVVEPIAEANQHKVFVDFMGRIMKDPAFAQVYEQATAGKEL